MQKPSPVLVLLAISAMTFSLLMFHALPFPPHWGALMPQDITRWWAVFTAPLEHASWEHVLSNITAWIGLAFLTLITLPRLTLIALPLIWVGAGVGTWWIGRESYHLGFSGVTYGLFFLLLFASLRRWTRDRATLAALAIGIWIYGSMASGILPIAPHVSWEGHLSGAIVGAILGVLFAHTWDPLPPPKTWPIEDEEWEVIDEPPPYVPFSSGQRAQTVRTPFPEK